MPIRSVLAWKLPDSPNNGCSSLVGLLLRLLALAAQGSQWYNFGSIFFCRRQLAAFTYLIQSHLGSCKCPITYVCLPHAPSCSLNCPCQYIAVYFLTLHSHGLLRASTSAIKNRYNLCTRFPGEHRDLGSFLYRENECGLGNKDQLSCLAWT